jgi:heptosyltransferase I
LMRLLIVKLSSLGDVVHALPAVTDASRAIADLDVHWVVEEAYRHIPAMHPSVTRVIPIALRRWRVRWWGASAEIGECIASLRRDAYDLVLDAQGLIKSSVVAGVCRGTRAGFDRASAREPLASMGYRHAIAVAKGQHAIDRQRALFAGALGYRCPSTPLDYGLPPTKSLRAGVVLAHGTTWDSKRWPEMFWIDLAARLTHSGVTVTLPWGSEAERECARRIAAGAPGAAVAERTDLRDMIDLLGRSAAVVSVDSGIGHLATALGVQTIALYGPTDANLTGCRGVTVENLTADFPCAPCMTRRCTYRGAPRVVDGACIEPPCFSTITPERVWQRLGSMVAS